jgi:uncharacterized protein YbjT (DUF2867 family)
MRVVVLGRTGPIGLKVVSRLRSDGVGAELATLHTGCDPHTADGLAEAVAGADVLVDVSGPPWSQDEDLIGFYAATTRNVVAAARSAGVGHVVLLSVVGAELEPRSTYLRAKALQERMIMCSGLPFTIVRATQFLDYAKVVSELATLDGLVRVPPVHLQPIGSADVTTAVARHAVGVPIDAVVEAGWPEFSPVVASVAV